MPTRPWPRQYLKSSAIDKTPTGANRVAMLCSDSSGLTVIDFSQARELSDNATSRSRLFGSGAECHCSFGCKRGDAVDWLDSFEGFHQRQRGNRATATSQG